MAEYKMVLTDKDLKDVLYGLELAIDRCCYESEWMSYQNLIDKLKKQSETPSADVEEVKHGEWKVAKECKTPLSHGYIRTEITYICPFCNYHFRKRMKFCGECGAKMDGRSGDK